MMVHCYVGLFVKRIITSSHDGTVYVETLFLKRILAISRDGTVLC